MNAAAIILCAGKGTRMNDNSMNKVCFDCAGKPVICRIVENMRAGGVSRFVIVVGHQSKSVMDALDGQPGVVYAYQKEQKGTGHAAMCGLKALDGMGYSGSVIISMGDKIVATEVVRDLLAKSSKVNAVWGVQPIAANPMGGHIMEVDGKPCGVIEMADAALMALEGVAPEDYESKLKALGLNAKKAAKVISLTKKVTPVSTQTVAGKTFSAEEALNARYANAGLYCFDLHSAIQAISTLGSNNAQGEIYLTDALEYFALKDDVELYEVAKAEDMLTFSTKAELREVSAFFMRKASQMIADIKSGAEDSFFTDLYGEGAAAEKDRYVNLLNQFIAKYGDEKVVITRAPGRVNIMGRHIDHRGGGVNMMAIQQDTVLVSSMRKDDIVSIDNVDKSYKASEFSISGCLALADHSDWLAYLDAEPVRAELQKNRGDWSNYVKSAVLRLQLESENPLCGMNIYASGEIPVAAGLSSSSSIVVATGEATIALNSLNLSQKRFIELCGEGEWFVGSRGGAADHAAMICSKKSHIVHMDFKPFAVGDCVRISEDYAVIVADSLIKSKKSEGSKDIYNAKVASYEFAFMLLKRFFPEYHFQEFRDIAEIRPFSKIYKMLKVLPEAATRKELIALLPEYADSVQKIFMSHADPGFYDLRGVALFGISECIRSKRCVNYLQDAEYDAIGKLMKASHNGDRVSVTYNYGDKVLERLASAESDIAMQPGAYGCSTLEIDNLSDYINSLDGVIGSELVGAGLGGCIIALVRKDSAENILQSINEFYYDKHSYPHSAAIYLPGEGSKTQF